MNDESATPSEPRNSYTTGLVVAGLVAVAMVLTAGLVIAAPLGSTGAGQGGEPPSTTTVAPTTSTLPSTTTLPATTTTRAPTTTTQAPPTTLGPTTTDPAAPGESIGAFVVGQGDCISLPDESLVETLETIPCGQPHDAEVYSLFDMSATSTSWPGRDAVIEAAVDGCLAAFQPFVGVAYEFSELEVYYLQPTEESWNELDDREIVCLITALDGSPLTGSMEGSGR